jgi:hypothetical protein
MRKHRLDVFDARRESTETRLSRDRHSRVVRNALQLRHENPEQRNKLIELKQDRSCITNRVYVSINYGHTIPTVPDCDYY